MSIFGGDNLKEWICPKQSQGMGNALNKLKEGDAQNILNEGGCSKQTQ